MSRYLIGIDLGTTNSALAYIEAKTKGQPRIQSFPVPQLVSAGTLADRQLLPSFLYLPGAHDLPPGACALPWDASRDYAVGEFARNHGAKVPGRLVTSAKSWLSHSGVDRSAAMLPWSAPPEVQRLSPVEASARYLRHLADAWNFVMAKEKADDRLENQHVVLTVPASFDDVARNLTVEAARKAGLEHLILLEEPQAAFYCWLATDQESRGKNILKPGMVCIVVDVGGGTSDFSLIQCVEQAGELGFVRQAVGDHLLLGGDNMDLALAKFVEGKLPNAGRLDAATFGTLTQACRFAKETLLAPKPPAEHTVTVMGRGRAVIGGAQQARITPDDARHIVFDGFFPLVGFEAEPSRTGRVGLHEMGLPYVSDPAISKHLSSFLRQHSGTKQKPPDAILFNGGVFQPESVRDRLLQVLRHWYDTDDRRYHPLVLTSPSLDLAVAWGAAYYGWLRHTGGKRISGGLARSYYVGVATEDGLGDKESGRQGDSVSLLCVVPQHLEEGNEITLEKPELELALGQPVTFPLYSSTVRGDDQPGQQLQLAPSQLLRLPPLHTILRGGKRSGTKNVPVKLSARLTEIGTLELWCVSRVGENRWRLEFNTRDIVPMQEEDEERTGGRDESQITDVWPEEQVQVAADLIRAAFSAIEEQPTRDLTKALERALGASRGDWPMGLCRRLWDFLAEVADQRRSSPAHLTRWYHLVGHCLRPGFGDSLDRFRVESLWKLLHSTAKPQAGAGRTGDGGADYWIMWRRVAGGLNATLQLSLFDRVRPVLLPSKSGKGPAFKPGANELAEMWRAVGSLERLDPKLKEQLGTVLLKQLRRSPAPVYGFWSLTRLGGRILLYGPLNAVVHPQVIEGWLHAILPVQPANDSELQSYAFCLTQLARRTNQRALDVNDETRSQIVQRLRALPVSARLPRLVEEGGELESSEQKQLFGDSLPIGLRLVGTEQ